MEKSGFGGANIVHNLEITKSDGQTYNIYGMFQVPLTFNPQWLENPEGRTFPVAIECHGYNTNSNGYLSAHWANTWCEKGYIAYTFDFVGGAPGQKENYSRGVRSGLKGAEPWDEYGGFWDHMSVKTEVEDLDLVIDQIKELDFINTDYICLMGQSQGGVVSALVAAQREKKREDEGLGSDIAGLVLIYPALSFVNDMHAQYPTLEDMEKAIDPESGRIFIMGANIGPDYIKDCYEWGKYDEAIGAITIYDMIKGYSNSVLIVTGSADTTVDPSWSYNAINQLTSPYGDTQSTLVLVSNALHAFDMMDTTPVKQKLMAYEALGNYLELNNLVPEEIVSEGIVLLENNDMEDGAKALPLRDNERSVHFFSMSSFDFINGGVGSGSIDDSSALRLKDVFAEAGFKVNTTLWDFYYSRYRYDQRSYEQERQGLTTGSWLVKDTNPSDFSAEAEDSYSNAGADDVAVTVIARIGGEGADLPHYKYYEQSVDEGNEHILQLTTNEKALLTEVGSKNFGKHIVIINTSNPMELDWLSNPEYGIDAVLMISTAGQAGLPAIPKVLTGEVNPSGRLVDTWAYDALSAPATRNMGKMSFTNYQEFNLGEQYNDYVVYQEGIYVGYKYYEARYYDKVMGQGNAGDFDYDATVQYPFGYGKSYTDFALSDFQMAKADNGDYTLSVKVANVGGTAGKSSVQFYMSAPYIPGSGVERAAVELVEFEKTDILEPGADETLTVTVPKEYLKAYNAEGEGGYVVQGGDYYFTAAFNAHDAVNDILAAKEGKSELSASPLAQKDSVAEDTETYKVSTQTGYPVKNQFGFADLNNIGYEITYLTRSDWTGTFPTTQELAANETIVDQEKFWEAADVPVDSAAKMPTLGGDGDVTAVQLMGKAYDDPMWEELLDRISFDEMQYFLRVGGYRTSAIPSIAFNAIGDQDGPAGISATLIGGGTTCMSYPSEATLGATFNKKLCEKFGTLVGEDGLHATSTNRQIAGWYAPAVNIHRTPFSGRNYEYYGEDSVMSGLMAARVINKVYDKGIVCFLKHFAFNDQESNRNGLCVFGHEQSLREIYLRPFEIALQNCNEGACTAIMSSYNRIGGTWTGASKELLTEVLRNEWGFVGRVLSDYIGSDVCKSYVSIYGGLYAGNDQLLNTNEGFFSLADAAKNPTIVNLMRNATHRVLYSAINSAGMNGTSADTRVMQLVPTWRALLWTGTAVISAGIIVWGGLLVFFQKKRAKKDAASK